MEKVEDSVSAAHDNPSTAEEEKMDSSTAVPDEEMKEDGEKTQAMEEEDIKPKIKIKKEEVVDEDPDNMDNSENEPDKSNEERREKKHRIEIKVCAQDGNELCFKVSQNLKMQKIMSTFAASINTDIGNLRFMLGSKRIRGEDTVTTLDMDEENNEIQVHFALTGG